MYTEDVRLYIIRMTLKIVGQSANQQNKDSSTSFLQAEGGGARRPRKYDIKNFISNLLFFFYI